MDAVFKIARTEGLAGLYAGFGGYAMYRVTMNGFRLGLFQPSKEWLTERVPWFSTVAIDALSAGFTGAIGGAAANPFQVIKTRSMSIRRCPSLSTRSRI